MRLINLKHIKIFSNGSLNFFYDNFLKNNSFLKSDYRNFYLNKKKLSLNFFKTKKYREKTLFKK